MEGKWHMMSEEPFYGWYLTFDERKLYGIDHYANGKWVCHNDDNNKVTHWMQLPPEPDAKK